MCEVFVYKHRLEELMQFWLIWMFFSALMKPPCWKDFELTAFSVIFRTEFWLGPPKIWRIFKYTFLCLMIQLWIYSSFYSPNTSSVLHSIDASICKCTYKQFEILASSDYFFPQKSNLYILRKSFLSIWLQLSQFRYRRPLFLLLPKI